MANVDKWPKLKPFILKLHFNGTILSQVFTTCTHRFIFLICIFNFVLICGSKAHNGSYLGISSDSVVNTTINEEVFIICNKSTSIRWSHVDSYCFFYRSLPFLNFGLDYLLVDEKNMKSLYIIMK